MFMTALGSARLFFTGKLFRDYRTVLGQLAIGVASGAIVIVLIGTIAPAWVATIAGGMVSGALQPLLFKNVKYA